jgi:bifunctional DNA-binding transcriptional regulator/antitoxin component of YhaV-PrlF toxin-antitoxin module
LVRLICRRKVDLLGRIVLPVSQTLEKTCGKELLFAVTPDIKSESIKIRLADQGLSTPSSLVKADEVNQILIPADVRISFGVEAYTEFNISFDDETKTYILVKVIPACAICEETEHIVFVSDKSVHNQYLCQSCINDIAEFLKKKQAKIL